MKDEIDFRQHATKAVDYSIRVALVSILAVIGEANLDAIGKKPNERFIRR